MLWARSGTKAYICRMIFTFVCCPKWRGCGVWSILLIILWLGESCKPALPSSEHEAPAPQSVDTLPSDFANFFKRFHEDSVFQLAHINFPLEGLPASLGDGDTLQHGRYFWQREDWKKHNRFTDPGGHFEQWYIVLNDRIIEHWIQMKGTNMYMKRRFAKLDDEWVLIYFQGLRPGTSD